jgi:hypothetical protein
LLTLIQDVVARSLTSNGTSVPTTDNRAILIRTIPVHSPLAALNLDIKVQRNSGIKRVDHDTQPGGSASVSRAKVDRSPVADVIGAVSPETVRVGIPASEVDVELRGRKFPLPLVVRVLDDDAQGSGLAGLNNRRDHHIFRARVVRSTDGDLLVDFVDHTTGPFFPPTEIRRVSVGTVEFSVLAA